MAHFDTGLVLEAITRDVLADDSTTRQILEIVDTECAAAPTDPRNLVGGILEVALRQMAQSQHGRDLVVGLMDRLMEDARAEGLARLQLSAAGLSTAEIDSAIEDFPELLDRWRRPTREELEQAGPI